MPFAYAVYDVFTSKLYADCGVANSANGPSAYVSAAVPIAREVAAAPPPVTVTVVTGVMVIGLVVVADTNRPVDVPE